MVMPTPARWRAESKCLAAHNGPGSDSGAVFMDFLLCVMQTGDLEWTHRQFIGLRALLKLVWTAMAMPVGGCLFVESTSC